MAFENCRVLSLGGRWRSLEGSLTLDSFSYRRTRTRYYERGKSIMQSRGTEMPLRWGRWRSWVDVLRTTYYLGPRGARAREELAKAGLGLAGGIPLPSELGIVPGGGAFFLVPADRLDLLNNLLAIRFRQRSESESFREETRCFSFRRIVSTC